MGIFIKLSKTLIVDKTPSELVRCGTEMYIHQKPFVHQPFEKWLYAKRHTKSYLYILNISVLDIPKYT